MNSGLLVALSGTAVLLLILLFVLLAVVLSARRRLQQALVAARAEVEVLRRRLDEVEAAHAAAIAPPVVPAVAPPVVPPTEYVITTAGVPTGSTKGASTHGGSADAVPNRAVLSVTFGEPLVKAVAFGYGVRRALSAESRNRITFEIRREIRRARKQRRRDTKDAIRRTRRQEATA
jgi:hypothetical protein